MEKILFAFLATILTLYGCGSTKTYVEIQEVQAVYSYGQLKYNVNKGDILEYITSKTCRSGRDECWKVRNVSTGEIGYVRAKEMMEKHYIYREKDGQITPLEK